MKVRRKFTAGAGTSACSACDLTHGGLKLDESADWKEAKHRIQAPVKQLHQDELTPELSNFVKSNKLRYPLVLGQAKSGALKVLIEGDQLLAVSKDHSAFLTLLSQRAEEEAVPLRIS